MEHVNLLQLRNANDLDENAYTISTNEKLSNIKIPINALLCKESHCTIHCKDVDIFITTLSLHLKHLALSVYQCLMLIRIHLFVQWQAGTSVLKNITALLKTHYGGGNIIINQIMMLFATTSGVARVTGARGQT